MNGNSNDYIKYLINKSEETYEDAKLLCNNSRWNSSINRLYYSSFHLVSALIHGKGLKAESHIGIKTLLNLHFVKSGLVSKEHGKLYANLFEWRQESDYVVFIEFEEGFVKELMHKVEVLNNHLLNLLNL